MRRGRRQGIAIIVVLLVISIMAVIAAAITTLGGHGLAIIRSHTRSDVALYAAEAGAWHAAKRLVDDSDFTGFDPQPVALQTVDATYEVTVTGPGPKLEPTVEVDIPDGAYYILSTGRSGDGTERRVGMLVQRTSSAYNFAGFAAEKITLEDGSYTDSWNSTLPDPPGTVTGQAHLGTNATAKESVEIKESKVDKGNGNVYVGPGAEPGVVKAKPSAYGDEIVMSQKFKMPTVSMDGKDTAGAADVTTEAPLVDDPTDQYDPLGYLIPGVYHNVNVNGWTLRLKPGEIYYFHVLNVTAGGQIFIPVGVKDPVTVKVYDKVVMSGGSVVNQTHLPRLMNFEVFDGKLGVALKGGAEAYYVAKAPQGDVVIDDGELYGSVICKNLTLTDDAAIHYDLDLPNLNGSGADNLRIISNQRF